mgnify:CR=1 FL=1
MRDGWLVTLAIVVTALWAVLAIVQRLLRRFVAWSERYLDEQRPDVVAITPLIGLVASSQLDLLRSARARGVPTAVFVWSWDHLSSKAVIRDHPDALLVWNEAQRREAIDMHLVSGPRRCASARLIVKTPALRAGRKKAPPRGAWPF